MSYKNHNQAINLSKFIVTGIVHGEQNTVQDLQINYEDIIIMLNL